MITTPTVLILGAGASMPFGFPSGGRLKTEIARLRRNATDRPPPNEITLLQDCGFTVDQITTFLDSLHYSPLSSVDAFLEHRPDFIPIGKAAIAQNLIKHEKDDDLFSEYVNTWDPSLTEPNLYHYIFNRINASHEKFAENQLTIVTFNYDRSFEHFLFTALKTLHGLDDAMAATTASYIPVIHVHGQMGLLGWQNTMFGVSSRRSYSPEVTPDTIQCAAQGIKIIHEAVDLSAFTMAKQHLDTASRVYFLGFGYHIKNMERLGIRSVLEKRAGPKSVVGTVFGMTNAEINYLQSSLTPATRHIDVGHANHKACEFLRNDLTWQSP